MTEVNRRLLRKKTQRRGSQEDGNRYTQEVEGRDIQFEGGF